MKNKNVMEHEAIENIKRLLTPVKKQTRIHKEKTDEQKLAMFERMAKMRIQLNESRKTRREFKEQHGNDLLDTRISTKKPILNNVVDNAVIDKNTHNQEFILFEKNYNSKIEKIDEAMSSISDTLREMNERKREKYQKKELLIQSQEQAKAEQKQAEQKQAEQKQAQEHNNQAETHNKQAQAHTQAHNKQAEHKQAHNTPAQEQAQAFNPNRIMKQPHGNSPFNKYR